MSERDDVTREILAWLEEGDAPTSSPTSTWSTTSPEADELPELPDVDQVAD